MSGSPTLAQVHFRFRNDPSRITSPNWVAAEDANISWPEDYNLRIRITVNNTGTGSSGAMLLRYSKNGGAYTTVTTSSNDVRAVDASANAAVGLTLATSEFALTAGAGTAEAGRYTETGTAAVLANGSYEEDEFAFVIRSADVSVGDTIDLRMYDAGPTAFTTYTVTPRITVSTPSYAFGDKLGAFSVNAASITNPFDAALVEGTGAVSVGDLVIAVAAEQTSKTATAVTDNLGNTYAPITAGTDSGTATGRAFYSCVTVAGTITVLHLACTASSDNAIFAAVSFQGPFAASPLDANPADNTDATSPFDCPATGTLAQADELVVAWSAHTPGSYGVTAPMVHQYDQADFAVVVGVSIGSYVVSSTTTTTPQFTSGTITDASNGTASFKKDVVTFTWSDTQVNQGYDPTRYRTEIVGY